MESSNNINVFNIIVLTSVILIIGLIIYNYYKVHQLANCGCGNTNTPPPVQKCGMVSTAGNNYTNELSNNDTNELSNNDTNELSNNDTNEPSNNVAIEQYNNAKTRLVLYYTTWCGHSKHFMSEWDKIKKEVSNGDLKNTITCEEFDCDKSQQICKNDKILGFPSLILHKSNGTKIDYPNQARTFDLVMAFIKNNL
jgi:hypothetical protein